MLPKTTWPRPMAFVKDSKKFKYENAPKTWKAE